MYLAIAAVAFVACTVGAFRINYRSDHFAGKAEQLFAISILLGILSGLLWPLAILTWIAGRIIRYTVHPKAGNDA